MSAPDLLLTGPHDAPLTFAFAHGAGAPMDTLFMTFFADALAEAGYRTARFEFPYMAERRKTAKKRPPDRQPVLEETWEAVIETLGPRKLVIGGKSMGGRMASLVADRTGVAGLICLGYPFHPPGKPDKPRTAHLEKLKTPTLICQGTRDPFGTKDDVAGYALSKAIRLHWAEDGNHDLAPRKASGRTKEQNWAEAANAMTAFMKARA